MKKVELNQNSERYINWDIPIVLISTKINHINLIKTHWRWIKSGVKNYQKNWNPIPNIKETYTRNIYSILEISKLHESDRLILHHNNELNLNRSHK